MRSIILKSLKIYKRSISPTLRYFFGNSCRFDPTCSEYASQAIENFGILKGGILATKRLIKCHPLSKPGYDPVIKTS